MKTFHKNEGFIEDIYAETCVLELFLDYSVANNPHGEKAASLSNFHNIQLLSSALIGNGRVMD